MTNTNAGELIAKLESAPEFGGAFYSKEQVINFLKMVQCTQPTTHAVDEQWLQKLYDKLRELRSDIETIEVDYDSVTFSLSGNEIELDSAEIGYIESYELATELMEYVDDAIIAINQSANQ